jgi:hypothetical protein
MVEISLPGSGEDLGWKIKQQNQPRLLDKWQEEAPASAVGVETTEPGHGVRVTQRNYVPRRRCPNPTRNEGPRKTQP